MSILGNLKQNFDFLSILRAISGLFISFFSIFDTYYDTLIATYLKIRLVTRHLNQIQIITRHLNQIFGPIEYNFDILFQPFVRFQAFIGLFYRPFGLF